MSDTSDTAPAPPAWSISPDTVIVTFEPDGVLELAEDLEATIREYLQRELADDASPENRDALGIEVGAAVVLVLDRMLERITRGSPDSRAKLLALWQDSAREVGES